MKAQVTIKSISRGDKGDTIKFVDDATGQLPPTIIINGGAKDGEKRSPKSLRFEGEAGKLLVAIREGKNARDVAIQGTLQRTDSWEVDEETGAIEASASLTFRMEGRLEPEEIADLFGAASVSIAFTASQKTLEFKKTGPQKIPA